jgi:transposase
MKKRPYRAVPVKTVDVADIRQRLSGQRLVVGVDVAKVDFVATLMTERGDSLLTVKWKHPTETRDFIRLLREASSSRLEVALEPTGTYGDALMGLLRQEGAEVFLVSAKRAHDAAEVYDGVPSFHDAKSSVLIAKLHLSGISRPWRVRSDPERELASALRTMDMYQEQFQSHVNRLEALLATYWPEAPKLLTLDSATLLALLAGLGCPQQVAARSEEACRLMRLAGGNLLREEKVQAVVHSAHSTIGVAPIAAERDALMEQAKDMQRCKEALRRARSRVERLSCAHDATRSLAPVVGKVTAAVIVSELGDPLEFLAAAIFAKAAGLNLKERSSGKHKGKLKLTKRGSSMVRKYLYLAAWRLVQTDPVVAAWYERKVERDGGIRNKALVAVMRKLIKSLWHVRTGATFDSSKLFDAARLGFADSKAA